MVEASGWRDKFRKLPPGRGIGFAASAYLSGAGLPIYWNDMPHSGVMVKIDRGGGVAAFCGSIDIGQGSDSVLAYVVAEVLGIRPEDVRVVTADTDLTPVDLGSYSSRVTLMTGNAAREAAEKLRDQHLTVTTCGLPECLDRVVEASGWREKFGKLPPGRGIGIAASSYLTGAGLPIYWNDMPHSGAMVKVDRGGCVTVFCGSIDIGQGSDSVLAYVVAEVLGIRPEDVRVVTADTDLTPVDLG